MMRLLQYFFTFLFLLSAYVASAQEPTNQATGFTVTAISTSAINIDWTDATGPTEPEFYLIVGRELPGGTFASVADGPEVAADADWTDDNFAAIVAHGGASALSVTGLNPGTQYEFRIYSYTENGGNGNYKLDAPPTASDFTFSLEPGGHSSTFTATLNGNVDIDLDFDAANTLTNADGYLIYRRAGSAASLTGLNDGAAPPASLGGTTTLIRTTNNLETSYSDTGLQGGVTYHYVLVPFNYDGANNGTYNYLTDGSEPRTNATTNLIISILQINGGGIATGALSTGTADVAILGFSITTNGPTTFNALNVAVTSTPVGKFTSPRIFKSANATYGGDNSINSGSLAASQLQFSAVGDVLTPGTTNYFIVVNVAASASGSIQPSFTQANATFTSPSGTAQAVTVTGETYTFVDNSPPTISSSIPAYGATGVSVLLNTFTINFDESVVFVGDNLDDANRIRIWDDDANAFVETIELLDVNVTGNVVTFTTDFAFLPNTNYDVIIGNSVFEDLVGNDFPGIAEDIWEFRTEAIPNITGFSNSGTRCIGDVLTINGSGFTGTGGSLINTKPVVTMEGVAVPPANITAFTNASITLTIPPGVATGSNTTVIVVNQDNLLSSDGSDDLSNLYDAIITGLTVTPETLTPAQNSDVDILIEGTQTSSYRYTLILISGPGGYSPGSEFSDGTNGDLTLTTTPVLNQIGDYEYRIDVSRTGCTTKALNYNPITLTVADLTVTATATSTTICNGITTRLIGAASGGTGFYQFTWTSNPPGFSSGSSSPTVSPSSTTTYFLTVTDNQGNDDQSSVVITVNPSITADIIPAPGQSTVQTNYNIENTNYQLYGDSVGVFSGTGVILSGGVYYFNPLTAGIGNHVITFTKTNVKGCSATDSETFVVKTSAISGLNLSYCQNTPSDSPLAPNSYSYGSYQFTRLVLWTYNWSTSTSCIADIAPSFTYCGTANPLTVNSYQLVPDIQAGVSKPLGSLFSQPASYSIDLDMIRSTFGYSATGFSPVSGFNFYLLIYVKDANGFEYFWDAQKFDVLRNDPAPIISGVKEGEAVCSDLTPITLSSSVPAYAVTNFSISPVAFNSSINSSTGVFDPDHASLSGADSRKLTATMAYTDQNNCPSSVSTDFIWVKRPSAPFANDTTYCAFTGIGTKPPYFIKASANGEVDRYLWYEFDPVLNPNTLDIGNGGPLFQPGNIDGLTAITDQFYVVQSNYGCKGDFNEVSIEIKSAPTAIFTNSNICEDRDFDLVGPKDGATPYPLYEWNFGDTNVESVTNDNENTYNYGPGSANKPYNISLRVTNSGGCQNEFSKTVIVGENPRPSFSLKFICDGDPTAFTATSVPASSEYSWDFDDGTTIARNDAGDPAPEGGTTQNPIHKFTDGPGDYTVTVTSYTASGCFNQSTKTISILDYLTYDTDNPYQMASSEDGGKGYWRLEDVNGNSTWEFAQPTTPMMKEFTSPAWVTNADGFYVADEKSYLNSPCLNISAIERPIISLDLIVDTDKNFEGAVLEYSKDNGINWVPLGAENSGLNWFNTTGFRIGNIGSSNVGWSGKSSEDLNDNNAGDTLVQARRALDNLPNLSLAERSKVRFRIAFATTEDAKDGFEGIGFNNLSISTRDRISLLEMFTNVNAANYTTNNNVFKAIAIDEIAKIQYHVTYPGDDANATVNKVDPAARAAYYGIPMSDQYIPRSYVDGYSEGTLIDGNWAIAEFNKQSLQNAQYVITIDSMQADDNSYLKMKVTVEAKTDIPATRNHILHIAVVEKVVGSNEYVLRKLVPDVNGRALPIMTQAEQAIVIDSVQLEKNFVNVNQLAIVAFVQDLSSREIFQAAIELNPGYLPVLVTGIESLAAEQINIYPNPASKQFRVELPAIVTNDVSMKLIDQVGRTHDGGVIRAGSNSTSVNIEHLSEGIYILEIGTSESIIRKKVMVVMKN